MEMIIEYPPSSASLFAVAAREVKNRWMWCPFCGEFSDQVFVRDDTGGVVYRCGCGNENKIGVKP